MRLAVAALLLLACVPLIVVAERPAYACDDNGYLYGFGIGDSFEKIVDGMSGACPSTIILNAGMDGFAVCEDSRYLKKILLLKNRVVVDERSGPDSFGDDCSW